MAEHLSNLVLDELAAGLPVDARAQDHAQSCADCRQRLERRSDHRAQVVGSPKYGRVFERLQARTVATPGPTRPPRWFLALAPVLAAAAAFAFFTLRPHEPLTRLKGGASVLVLRAPDGAPLSTARPGERVVLSVMGAGASYALVMGIDESGEVQQVWPVQQVRPFRGTQSGRILVDTGFRLEPGFEVTPGSLALHAFFSNEPLRADAVVAQLQEAVHEARLTGRSPLEANALPQPGVLRARTLLKVEPGP